MPWSILLVEDEPDIRHVMELALGRDSRFAIEPCSRGSEAVSHAEADRPPFDCALLDYMLPDMTNAELIARLRAAPATRAAKLVLVTAFTPRGGIGDYRDAGADAVILKPFDVLALSEQVEAILSGIDEPGMVYDRAWRSSRRNAAVNGRS